MSILMYGGGGNSAVSHPYGRLTRYLKEQSKGGNDDIADGIFSSALNQAGIRAREKTSMKLGEKAAQQLAKALSGGVCSASQREGGTSPGGWEGV